MKKRVNLGDREAVIVGTSHISEKSREEVRETIEEEKPDLIGVELDENRLKSLKEDSGWKELDLSEAIRNGQAPLLFTNLLLSIYQRRLGLEGAKPGMEMLDAVEAAEEKGVEYSLIDRDINETLSRAFSETSFFEKLKLLGSFFFPSGAEEVDLENIQDGGDILDTLVEELKDDFPSINRVLLEERNSYMAEKLLEKEFEKAVVVVGAGHVDGLAEELRQPGYDPETSWSMPWKKVFGYGLPAAIIIGISYSFYVGFSQGVDNLTFWFASNSILALLGAIIARSHVFTWMVSFLSSPFTSLNPMLPAGLVAAYTESKIHPPKVGELETIAEIESYRELWGNQVGRILLTFFLVNLGSGSAAIMSAAFIFLYHFV